MPDNNLRHFNKRDMALMLINYQKNRIRCLEGREKWFIIVIFISVGVNIFKFTGVV